jgi:osmotically-inducible protein OsmY
MALNCAAVAALAIGTVACGGGGDDPSGRVAQALEHERIKGVDVTRDQEFLILKGEVDSVERRSQAGRIAAQAAGRSATVINELSVPNETPANAPDGDIRHRVVAMVQSDPQLRDRDIDVDVEQGVVIMTGDVRSHEEKQRAEQLARQLTGVREVANGLDVIG